MIENEIAILRSIKTQFGFLVKFSIIRYNETIPGPLFLFEWPTSIFNENNEATIEDVFIRISDEVKGEIEERSQRGYGLVIEGTLKAFVNAALYEPFRGGSYMPLLKSCKIRT